ncbi:Putative DNA ligase-like protein [Pirellula sp. SH-Sr6A]|uniref:ATP-dependent DNA ligase n=1 Tax=Pirellula sp. SH-Sr6A TaxID=1632865 RepID=UPI00078D2898|nr:ATP-dependent DNA ligase [Pirellula sp. SH-Sr6A]AMV30823.1 Putative DNA ligase-like protein [Pirellula sp. SH-Sr6A]
MRAFCQLYRQIDETTKTNAKLGALVRYFREVEPRDGAWAVYFLSGNRPKRSLSGAAIREWVQKRTSLPDWLIEESYQYVGDLAETVHLLAGSNASPSTVSLASWVESFLIPLSRSPVEEALSSLDSVWDTLPGSERFVALKMITGGFRVGVSRGLVTRALSLAFEIPPEHIAHRLMGSWTPSEEFFRRLRSPASSSSFEGQPFPFCLANALESDPAVLGLPSDYLVEWKWDGIRAQAIRRSGEFYLWSRGEERIEEQFPEVTKSLLGLPDGTVLDGELLAWQGDKPMPFQAMQRRLGRRKVGRKLLTEVPVRFVAFDLLELDGRDVRDQPLEWRRAALENLRSALGDPTLAESTQDPIWNISPIVSGDSWDAIALAREGAREIEAEGLVVKRKSSPYSGGRTKGVWWKWKVAPWTFDAVLLYAQRGHGRRASLYTDFTFAVWDGDLLVPCAKAYSGLTDDELRAVDRFVRENTREKFGPVRSVAPKLVMEIACEGIQPSTRHKSGVAVRFPRILRLRLDKTPDLADSLDSLKQRIVDRANTTEENENA